MKNLLILIFASLFILSSCEDQDGMVMMQTELKAPSYGDDFTITGVSDGSVRAIIVLTIGRKSTGCRNLGVCRLCFFCPSDSETQDYQNKVSTPVNLDANGNRYIELHLNNTMANSLDTNLYIDENLLDENGNIVINSGVYPINNSLGEYGGYKININ